MNEQKRKKDYLTIFVLIILIIGTGIVIWDIKYNKPIEEQQIEEKENEELIDENKEYQVLKFENEYKYQKILDKTIINYQRKNGTNELNNIYDIQGNEIYKSNNTFNFDKIFQGTDDNIYFETIIESETGTENIVTLHTIIDNKVKKIFTGEETGGKYKRILCNEKLVGYAFISNDIEDIKNKIHLLNKDEDIELKYGLDKYYEDENIELKNEKAIIISEIKNDKISYGVYNLKTDKKEIDCNYEYMNQTYNNDFIVVKDNKYAVINNNLRKRLNYEYDFIDTYKDYYVTGKDKKINIYTKKYDLVTTLDIDYTKESFDYNFSEIMNNLVLIINPETEQEQTVIVDSEYKLKENKIKNLKFENDCIYSYDKNTKTLTIYDENFNTKTNIELDEYDILVEKISCYKYENILVISNNSTSLVYNLEDGSSIENKQYEIDLNNIKLAIDLKENLITINNSKEDNIKPISDNNTIYKIIEGNMLINTKHEMVIIKRS